MSRATPPVQSPCCCCCLLLLANAQESPVMSTSPLPIVAHFFAGQWDLRRDDISRYLRNSAETTLPPSSPEAGEGKQLHISILKKKKKKHLSHQTLLASTERISHSMTNHPLKYYLTWINVPRAMHQLKITPSLYTKVLQTNMLLIFIRHNNSTHLLTD